MITDYKFPDFDTSFWLIKDKAWMEQRKHEWAAIESMLAHKKSKKGLMAVKNYFLKGKLPEWDKLRHWNSYERHLDLFIFLWLHPSNDRDTLISLRNDYMTSVVIRFEDITTGYSIFFREFIIMASQNYVGDLEEDLKFCIITKGKVELLFDVMMFGLNKPEYDYQFLYLDDKEPEVRKFVTPIAKPDDIWIMGKWLSVSKYKNFNSEFLFQFTKPLEWWYINFPKDEEYFPEEVQDEAVRRNHILALYRIHNFNTEKEGDTPRTRFVTKMRKILDEREFIPEFKQMWEDVKSGKIVVENAWER